MHTSLSKHMNDGYVNILKKVGLVAARGARPLFWYNYGSGLHLWHPPLLFLVFLDDTIDVFNNFFVFLAVWNFGGISATIREL